MNTRSILGLLFSASFILLSPFCLHAKIDAYAGIFTGAYRADAGTTKLPYLPTSTKSGTKAFTETMLGLNLNSWLSLEAGYGIFSSFTNELDADPRILTFLPLADYETTKLKTLRISPVVRFQVTEKFQLGFLGGLTIPDGEITRHIDANRPLPFDASTSLLYFPNVEKADLDGNGWHVGALASWQLHSKLKLETRYLHQNAGRHPFTGSHLKTDSLQLGLTYTF